MRTSSRSSRSLEVLAAGLALWLGLSGCGPHPAANTAPTATMPDGTPIASTDAQVPPPALPPKLEAVKVPEVHTEDVQGIKVHSVSLPSSNLTELRMLIAVGSSRDADHPGTAELCARLFLEGLRAQSALDPRVFAGATIQVLPDSTILKVSVLSDSVGPTLDAVGRVLQKRSFDAAVLKRVKDRTTEDLRVRRADKETIGKRLVRRDLFVAPVARHPYSVTEPTDEDIAKIDLKLVNARFDAGYVSDAIDLVFATKLSSTEVGAAVKAAFPKLIAGTRVTGPLDEPEARPQRLKVMLVDDPTQESVRLTIGRVVPTGEEFVWTWIYAHVVASRLEQLGARDARFSQEPLRDGPSLGFLEMKVPTTDFSRLVSALSSDAPAWSTEPSAVEVARARNQVNGALRRAIDSPAGVADIIAGWLAAGVPPTMLAEESTSLEAATPIEVTLAAQKYGKHDEIMVVVGDARSIGPLLSALGEVDVLDPAHAFERSRSIPRAAPPAAVEPAAVPKVAP